MTTKLVSDGAVVVYGRQPRSAWAFHPSGTRHPMLLALEARLLRQGFRLVPRPTDLAAFAAPGTPAPALEFARHILEGEP